MTTKETKIAKEEYTVRTEWNVTYYCDTTVRATSREDAARIVMQESEPDYDSQESYDDSGDTYVAGVSQGGDYNCMTDYGVGIPEGMGEPEIDGDLRDAAREVLANWSRGDLAGAVRALAAALGD